MAKYEALPTITIHPDHTKLEKQHLPELVHLEDSALSVMIDFSKTPPYTIKPEDNMEHAIEEMEVTGTHLLLVVNAEGDFHGVLSSQDVLGEKPIKIIQERRVTRDQILVKTIMVPHTQIIAIDDTLLQHTHVGHIVKTLHEHHKQYALVVTASTDKKTQKVRGIFTMAQLRKQLHMDL